MADNTDLISSENNLNAANEIHYIRRADRTPEKVFNKLATTDKKRICARRSLTDRVREKITRLEEEVDSRTKEVECERKQKKQLESQLQGYLKDMYENPDVNQELRKRLPKANKSDPFKIEEQTETDLSSIEEQIVVDGEEESASEDQAAKGTVDGGEGAMVRDSTKHNMARVKTSTPKSKRNLDFDGDGMRGLRQKTSCETQTPLDLLDRLPLRLNEPHAGPALGYYGYPIGANPYLSLNGGLSSSLHNPMFNSSSLLVPTLQRPNSSPLFRSPTLDHAAPASHTPILQASSVPNLSAAIPSGSLVHGAMARQSEASFSTTSSTVLTTATTSDIVGATADMTARNGCSASGISTLPSHTLSMDSGISSGSYHSYLSPPHPSLSRSSLLTHTAPISRPGVSPIPGPDTDRQIASLLKEIESQRALYRKMEADLEAKSRELETLQLSQRMQQLEGQAGVSEVGKAAGLVEEVYEAQKKRDDATRGRMELANEERDNVLARLRQLELRLDAQRSHIDHSEDDLHLDIEQLENEDLHHLLSRMDSASPSEQDVNTLVQKVEEMHQKQREINQEELQVVMEQRDVALARCRKLEAELLRYQKQSEADGGMDGNIKAKLTTLQQERDLAVAKSKQLDNQVQTLRLYYSLHNSISAEVPVREPIQHTTVQPTELMDVRSQLQHAEKENGRLVGQLRTVTIEKKQLQEALDSARQDKERLQRLVTVLKRKINGQPPSENPDTQ